ncbi:probable F-box protein At5g04010 [Prosopis cineraria]|uniref:probable F-box protein At5g04010 n=1 Tax=Prosopis cineraria TaxID=364024 RepID=UPI00240FE2B4|nr:probable F-box protein At5g04010 [Prosopis cineraria]
MRLYFQSSNSRRTVLRTSKPARVYPIDGAGGELTGAVSPCTAPPSSTCLPCSPNHPALSSYTPRPQPFSPSSSPLSSEKTPKNDAAYTLPMISPPSSPPWEALLLVAHHLDPKTLAIASCVSKLWSISMSSDHLWRPIFISHFPSLSTLQHAHPTVSFRRLFAIGRAASKRRLQNPAKPKLSLNDLLFVISVSTPECRVFTLMVPGDEMVADPHGLFRFDFEICESEWVREGLEEVKVTWNVILEGWKEVFCMMDSVGKLGFQAGGDCWFSVELPTPGCCSNVVASSVVADLKLGICSGKERDGKVRTKKVTVGILNIMDWRYVRVEDGLRYLQHFLNCDS